MAIGPARGGERLRGRSPLPREVPGPPPPRRDPDLRGRTRRLHVAGRARVLRAAAPPEDRRGEPLLHPRRADAAGDGRGGGEGRARRRLPGRRDRRVPRRRAPELLLPRDEHEAAGRAPGHRALHRARPRPAADRGGGGWARPGPGRDRPARTRRRGACLRRGPGPELPPQPGADQLPARPERPGHPRRRRRLRRVGRAAVLRPHDLEAARLGADARAGDRAAAARARRVHRPRHHREPALPARRLRSPRLSLRRLRHGLLPGVRGGAARGARSAERDGGAHRGRGGGPPARPRAGRFRRAGRRGPIELALLGRARAPGGELP